MSTNVLIDTFTDTNGTALTAHTPDFPTTGGAWSLIGASSSMTIQSARLLDAGATSTNYYAINAATLSGDFTGSVDLFAGNTTILAFGMVFCWTDVNNHYGLRWNGFGTPQWDLYKWTAGTQTVFGNYATVGERLTNSTFTTLGVTRVGNVFTPTLNGTALTLTTGTNTDSSYTSGALGLFGVHASAVVQQYDNLSFISNVVIPRVRRKQTLTNVSRARVVPVNKTLLTAGATRYVLPLPADYYTPRNPAVTIAQAVRPTVTIVT